MASTRTTITLGHDLAGEARRLGVNVSAAARRGVLDAVREALARADREIYRRHPEQPDPRWNEVEAWGDE
jgi:post-segregation antitoxin (ccd killing protein)